MRSAFAGLAALWFGYAALYFLPSGVYPNTGPSGGFDGDPGALAVMEATRTLCAGLFFLSVALVDWNWLRREMTEPPPDPPWKAP